MTELSPESKALIELARDDDEPTAADRARVRRALGTSLATGLAVSSATSLAAAGAKAGTVGAAAAAGGMVKIALWVGAGVVLGAASTGAVFLATRGAPAEHAPVQRAVPQPTAVVRPSPAREEPIIEAAPEDTTTIPLEVTAKPAAKPTAPMPSSLATEMRLLETARAALSGGDARRALAIIEQHEREYPAGSLVEERRASKVFALCELGRRAEAARAASEFLRTAPSSPLRGRVLDSCGVRE